jgi:hypothetical protein
MVTPESTLNLLQPFHHDHFLHLATSDCRGSFQTIAKMHTHGVSYIKQRLRQQTSTTQLCRTSRGMLFPRSDEWGSIAVGYLGPFGTRTALNRCLD